MSTPEEVAEEEVEEATTRTTTVPLVSSNPEEVVEVIRTNLNVSGIYLEFPFNNFSSKLLARQKL